MTGVTARTRLATAARSLLRVVPDRVLARFLPGDLGWDPDAMKVAEPRDADSPTRLLIAPVNSAGQAFRWARAAESNLPDVSAVNLMSSNARTAHYGFPADVRVPDSGFIFAHGWQRRQRDAITQGFTHVILESGRYMYGSRPGRTPREILDEIRGEGVAVALLWHGTDIRVPSEHARWERDSPFGADGAYPQTSRRVLESNARERRDMFASAGVPVFVSTPGLLDVPDSQWIPVVVDVDAWLSTDAPLQHPRPVVAYAPSSSALKGDPSIDVQLGELDAQGLIEYRRVQDIPSEQMPELYRSADIVLDQFRLGDYGVAACEAMAAGRLVIGHVHDDVRERVRLKTGLEIPIVESRYSDVGATIASVLADRDPWRAHAARGTAYVRELHDGRASAAALADFLAQTTPDQPDDRESRS